MALGERSTRRPAALDKAARWIAAEFERLGLRVERASYVADGIECVNLLDFARDRYGSRKI